MSTNLAILGLAVKRGTARAEPFIARTRRYTPGMGRRVGKKTDPVSESRRVLAANLKSICSTKELSVTALARALKMPQRTIQNIISMSADPQVGNIDKIAIGLGLKAWQLLQCETSPERLEMLSVLNQASPEGRRMIEFAVKSAREEILEGTAQGDSSHGGVASR